MNTKTLSKEIELTFPVVEMPRGVELLFQKEDFLIDNSLVKDIEEYRNKNISGDAIRLLHQEMSYLSAKAWRWILPHYLKFCLTDEAEYNQMETEFLIYALSPTLEFQSDTLQRLSFLDTAQINCLLHFLKWCMHHQFWKEYCPDEINRAILFLEKEAIPLAQKRENRGHY